MGLMVDGGCAEYVRCPEVNCLPYPENLDWVHTAAVPLLVQTAWHMLLNRAQLQPGEDVLVIAAGNGVGSAAIPIAKFFGARVIVTAGNDEKLANAREIGADEGRVAAEFTPAVRLRQSRVQFLSPAFRWLLTRKSWFAHPDSPGELEFRFPVSLQ